MDKINFSYASEVEHNFAQRLIIKTIEANIANTDMICVMFKLTSGLPSPSMSTL